MFVNNIDPVLVHLDFISSGLGIRYYGLIYALGFLVTYFFLQNQKKFLKLTADQIDKLFLYILVGDIIGARLLDFVFYRPLTLFTNPLEIFKVWNGGLSFHGGLIGIVLAIYLFSRKYKTSTYKITDTIVIPAAIVLFFGRIANFINSELVGRVTSLPWGVNFNNENISGKLIYRHPSQLYEAIKNIFIFGTLFLIKLNEDKHKSYKEGFRTWIFILLYGLLRIITNIWRDEPTWFFNTLGTGQVLSLIMVTVAIVVLWKNYKTNFFNVKTL